MRRLAFALINPGNVKFNDLPLLMDLDEDTATRRCVQSVSKSSYIRHGHAHYGQHQRTGGYFLPFTQKNLILGKCGLKHAYIHNVSMYPVH